MRRVAVVGSSGAGKTTFARVLAARLGVPHVELDALQHGPGWIPRPEFGSDVDTACPATGAWVADGNYDRTPVKDRADTIVWLDYERSLVMRRLLARTVRRVVRRELLWGHLREDPRRLLSRDPERNVLLWSWTRHGAYRDAYAARADGRWVRLRSPSAAAAWLRSLA